MPTPEARPTASAQSITTASFGSSIFDRYLIKFAAPTIPKALARLEAACSSNCSKPCCIAARGTPPKTARTRKSAHPTTGRPRRDEEGGCGMQRLIPSGLQRQPFGDLLFEPPDEPI